MRPKRPEHAVTVHARVAFNQCDPLGVAWHGRYLEWLEAARCELFASRGLDIPELAALGHRMYVVEARCRYMTPLRYGNDVEVTAWFTQLEPLVRVAYDVRNGATGVWCARAHTLLASIDENDVLQTKLPRVVIDRLPRLSASTIPPGRPQK